MSRIDDVLAVLAALALGAAVATVPASAQTAPVAFDRFLNGFERSCNFGEEYQRFVDSLMPYDPDRRQYALSERAEMPDRIRPGVGRAELTSDGETTVVTMPVRGTYRRLPVRALRITRGNGVAVIGDALVFDAPLATVRRTLGAMVARSGRGIQEVEEIGPVGGIGIEERDGAVLLECYAAF